MQTLFFLVLYSLLCVVSATQLCGNGLCEENEDFATCPADCTEVLCNSNGICEADENSVSCPSDCSDVVCDGNGICENGETELNCPQDCGEIVCNGNGLCETGETAENCPQDCQTEVCDRNGICEFGETPENCPSDCFTEAFCGNLLCEVGETVDTCPSDCLTGSTCGNGICEAAESSVSCPADCLVACGNGVCDFGEDSDNCPADCAITGTTGTTTGATTGATTGSTTGTTGVGTGATTGTTGTPTTGTTGSPSCIPDCTNKVCGSDGCDGECGICSNDTYCNSAGTVCAAGAEVTGQVLDANNNLAVFDATCELLQDELFFTSETNDNGEYLFENVGPGEYLLACNSPRYYEGSILVLVMMGQTEVVLPELRLVADPCQTIPPCSDNGVCQDGVCQCNEGFGRYDCSESLLDENCTPYRGFTESKVNSVLIQSALTKSYNRLNSMKQDLQYIQEHLPEFKSNSCCTGPNFNATSSGYDYEPSLDQIAAVTFSFLADFESYEQDNEAFYNMIAGVARRH